MAEVSEERTSLEKKFQCPVCLECCLEPFLLTPCQHYICLGCLKALQKTQSSLFCPMCRTAVKKALPNVKLERKMASFEAQCPGCGNKVELSEMKQHVSSCAILIRLERIYSQENQGDLEITRQMRDEQHRQNVCKPHSQPYNQLGGHDQSSQGNQSTFTCPYCPESNLSSPQLISHCNSLHQLNRDNVVCPICASKPWGNPYQASRNFIGHLKLRHQFNYDSFVDDNLLEANMLAEALHCSYMIME